MRCAANVLGCEPFDSCRHFRTRCNSAQRDQISTGNCEKHAECGDSQWVVHHRVQEQQNDYDRRCLGEGQIQRDFGLGPLPIRPAHPPGTIGKINIIVSRRSPRPDHQFPKLVIAFFIGICRHSSYNRQHEKPDYGSFFLTRFYHAQFPVASPGGNSVGR